MHALEFLPLELILLIVEDLPTSSLNFLSRTSNLFNRGLTGLLYKRLLPTRSEWDSKDAPLIWAIRERKTLAVKPLLEYDNTSVLNPAMRLAAELGDEETFGLLLAQGADPSNYAKPFTSEENAPHYRMRYRLRPLINASYLGHISIVTRLMRFWSLLSEAGSSEDRILDGPTHKNLLWALVYAIRGNRVDIAEFLSSKTILTVPAAAGPSLFFEAVEHGNIESMVFLYSKRHEINNSTSPLPMGFKLSWPCRWAHQHGYIHCLSLYGSVLHITAKSPTVKQYMSTSSVEIARLLLQWGVNLEANNEYSEKPLHHAARWCDSGLIKFLLDCGATVDCVDQAGWTPLFEAICQNDNDSIIFLLLQHGADINKKLKDGRTLLHFCTDEEKDDQMQRVIELGQTSISRIVMDEHHSILQLARDPGL